MVIFKYQMREMVKKLTWQIPANTLKTGDTTEFSIDVNLKRRRI